MEDIDLWVDFVLVRKYHTDMNEQHQLTISSLVKLGTAIKAFPSSNLSIDILQYASELTPILHSGDMGVGEDMLGTDEAADRLIDLVDRGIMK